MTVVTALFGPRELLYNLTLRELRGKYKRTTLGHVWSLINPLAMMGIYTVIFGMVLRFAPEVGYGGHANYAMFLLSALLPWTFVSNTLQNGMESLMVNSNLIKKVYFQRDVLVTSTVLSWDVSFGIELVVFTIVLLIFGFMPLPLLPLAIVFVVLLSLFGLGLAYALSVAIVYFRDTKHFMAIFIQIWFYLTPIIYPPKMVHDFAAEHGTTGSVLLNLYRLNPMTRFAEVFRDCFYKTQVPVWTDLVYCVVVPLVTLVVGYHVFRRFEGRLAEEL